MEVDQLTDIGKRRRSNQDQAGVFYNDEQAPLLVLCDGMGGHNAGDVASKMALQHVGEAWEQAASLAQGQLSDWLKTTITQANNHVYETSLEQIKLSGMGTTIVCMTLAGGQAVIAHVGDSRLYRFRDGTLTQLTKDHSYVQQLVDLALISPEEAQHHPQKNLVTQSVGVTPDVLVTIDKDAAQTGDLYLLCSDGLSDMLTDQEIAAILAEEQSVSETCQALVAQANAAGGFDNVTVLIMKVEAGDVA